MRLHGVQREKELLSDLPLGQVGREQGENRQLGAARKLVERLTVGGGETECLLEPGGPRREATRIGERREALPDQVEPCDDRRESASRELRFDEDELRVGVLDGWLRRATQLLAAACLALDPAVVVLPEQRGRERGVREARRPRPSESGASCELERTLSACLREVWTAGVRVEQRQRRKGEHDAVGAVSRLWAGNGLVCAIA